MDEEEAAYDRFITILAEIILEIVQKEEAD
jgi:hypothetical protein